MAVPKLRFKEFEGEWSRGLLKDFIITIESGWSPKCLMESVNKGQWGSLKTTSISWQGYAPEENKKLPVNLMPRDDIEVHIDDILITRVGPQDRVGVVAHVDQPWEKLMVSDNMFRLRVNEKVKPAFTSLVLGSFSVQKSWNQKIAGMASAQVVINQKTIKSTVFHLPSLPEQQKIAGFLGAVDEKIQQLTQKKALLEQYKKGVMQKLFSQELRFKQDDGKDFPDWEEKKLGEVAKFLKGKGISKADIVEEGTLECIRYGELYTVYGETILDVVSRTNTSKDELVLSQMDDVIIPASGETQIDIATASCVRKSNVALGGDLNIIRSANDGVFLAYYLNSALKFEIARLSQGISVVHLYSSQLKTLKLYIPIIEEQQKIATFLSGLDSKIEGVDNQITQTQTFKKGLLQQMFV